MQIYEEINEVSDNLTDLNKDASVARITAIIEKVNASGSPYTSRTWDLLRLAITHIQENTLVAAKTALGMASATFKGGGPSPRRSFSK